MQIIGYAPSKGGYYRGEKSLSPVDDDDGRLWRDYLCRLHHRQWFGQKTDERTSNLN